MRNGKAVQYDRYGDFSVVELVPQEKPTAGPGEIVVEIVAAGLNHIERFLREGSSGTTSSSSSRHGRASTSPASSGRGATA
ncbi:hypothetical protein QP157_09610 [Sphingomonas sp. LR61]|uniref:hypothetical protein n=1 Tax=Sphingomonas sp. LR61 TaxID=3050234 RepID=UPI002FE26CDC